MTTKRIAELTESIFGGNSSAFVLREERPTGVKFVGRIDVPKSTGNTKEDENLASQLLGAVQNWQKTGKIPQGPFPAV